MLLLEDAEKILRGHVRMGHADLAVALLRRVVDERTRAMHQRAQDAESRAYRAEKANARLTNLIATDKE